MESGQRAAGLQAGTFNQATSRYQGGPGGISPAVHACADVHTQELQYRHAAAGRLAVRSIVHAKVQGEERSRSGQRWGRDGTPDASDRSDIAWACHPCSPACIYSIVALLPPRRRLPACIAVPQPPTRDASVTMLSLSYPSPLLLRPRSCSPAALTALRHAHAVRGRAKARRRDRR